MSFAPPPVPTSPDTLCCVWMARKCSVYIQGKGANCTVLTYATGTQLFMAEGHNHYRGLVHGLHVEKNNSTCNTCLTIVKFWKYMHNLQMWLRDANTTWWAACWRPMSYANSFTDSTVASNTHPFIFTWRTFEYANAWGGAQKNLAIQFIHLATTEIYCTLKACCLISFIFYKMPFTSQFYFYCSNNTSL